MRLDNFEEKVNSTILQRGIAYWKSKAVEELEQEGKKIEAWVTGTEDYRVEIEIDQEEITWHSCTCPYDGGPVCKHIVAVLFEIVKIEAEELEPEQAAIKKKTITKKKSKKPQFKSLIKELSEEELREFIVELGSSDRKLKDRFMAFFAHKWSTGNKEDYKIIFRNIMREYIGRDGFLDYYNSRKFAKEIYSMMEEIPQWIISSPQNALALCQAIIEESHEVYQAGVDDSSGEFGGLSSYALDYLKQLSEKADEALQEEIFTYCISESEHKVYSNYGDAWDGFMDIAVPLTDTKERMGILFKALDKKLKGSPETGWSRDYDVEAVAKIKHEVLSVLDPEKAAALLEEQIKLPSFRKKAIEEALRKKDFAYAKKLAEDGVMDDEKKAGLVRQWKDFLYKIALETKDEASALELAEYFFDKRHKSMKDFHRLKEHYPKDEWDEKVTKILTRLSGGKNQWYGFGVTHEICVEEERWEVLKNNLSNATDFETLKQYGQYIITHFDKETLRDMYALVVADKLKEVSGRSGYEEACKGIIQMKSLSNKEFIQNFVQSFKDKYSNRRAMIDELNKTL